MLLLAPSDLRVVELMDRSEKAGWCFFWAFLNETRSRVVENMMLNNESKSKDDADANERVEFGSKGEDLDSVRRICSGSSFLSNQLNRSPTLTPIDWLMNVVYDILTS